LCDGITPDHVIWSVIHVLFAPSRVAVCVRSPTTLIVLLAGRSAVRILGDGIDVEADDVRRPAIRAQLFDACRPGAWMIATGCDGSSALILVVDRGERLRIDAAVLRLVRTFVERRAAVLSELATSLVRSFICGSFAIGDAASCKYDQQRMPWGCAASSMSFSSRSIASGVQPRHFSPSGGAPVRSMLPPLATDLVERIHAGRKLDVRGRREREADRKERLLVGRRGTPAGSILTTDALDPSASSEAASGSPSAELQAAASAATTTTMYVRFP